MNHPSAQDQFSIRVLPPARAGEGDGEHWVGTKAGWSQLGFSWSCCLGGPCSRLAIPSPQGGGLSLGRCPAALPVLGWASSFWGAFLEGSSLSGGDRQPVWESSHRGGAAPWKDSSVGSSAPAPGRGRNLALSISSALLSSPLISMFKARDGAVPSPAYQEYLRLMGDPWS